ncbi:MAG: hypothetical protein BWY56_02606 [Acidobacteria bacterium ADurb.Bin340]|nr:MAG: hypothetical protein BWY56_02606 [Acidobacteria bacterium ADurb.Bin340]
MRRPILAVPTLELCQSTSSKVSTPFLWVSVTVRSLLKPQRPPSQLMASPSRTLRSSKAMAAVKIFMVEPGS